MIEKNIYYYKNQRVYVFVHNVSFIFLFLRCVTGCTNWQQTHRCCWPTLGSSCSLTARWKCMDPLLALCCPLNCLLPAGNCLKTSYLSWPISGSRSVHWMSETHVVTGLVSLSVISSFMLLKMIIIQFCVIGTLQSKSNTSLSYIQYVSLLFFNNIDFDVYNLFECLHHFGWMCDISSLNNSVLTEYSGGRSRSH